MKRKPIQSLTGGKRIRVPAGDVITIPLPNGLFAFARILNDAGLAIYDHLASDASTIESFVDLRIRFYTGFFDKSHSRRNLDRHRSRRCVK